MNDYVLIELATRWEKDAKGNGVEMLEDTPNGKAIVAMGKGYREAKRECADTIRMLVSLLGDKPDNN